MNTLNTALLWGGLGIVALGGGIQLWGYVQTKKAASTTSTRDEYNNSIHSARMKYYAAYALYGVGAAGMIVSLVLHFNNHKKTRVSALPLPGGAALTTRIEW